MRKKERKQNGLDRKEGKGWPFGANCAVLGKLTFQTSFTILTCKMGIMTF